MNVIHTSFAPKFVASMTILDAQTETLRKLLAAFNTWNVEAIVALCAEHSTRSMLPDKTLAVAPGRQAEEKAGWQQLGQLWQGIFQVRRDSQNTVL